MRSANWHTVRHCVQALSRAVSFSPFLFLSYSFPAIPFERAFAGIPRKSVTHNPSKIGMQSFSYSIPSITKHANCNSIDIASGVQHDSILSLLFCSLPSVSFDRAVKRINRIEFPFFDGERERDAKYNLSHHSTLLQGCRANDLPQEVGRESDVE